MSDLKGITAVTIDTFYYQDVRRCIEAAIELAGAIGDCRAPRLGGSVRFEFNTVTITVHKDSDPDMIYQKFHRDVMASVALKSMALDLE